MTKEELEEMLKWQKPKEPIYYMSARGMKILDKAIKQYVKANNIIIKDENRTI